MIKSVAGDFAERLNTAGMQRFFAAAGDSLNGLIASLRRGRGIECIHVRRNALLGPAEANFPRLS